MKDLIRFVGSRWAVERKADRVYITHAISAETVSLNDPNYDKPNEPGRLEVPEYVLRIARRMLQP